MLLQIISTQLQLYLQSRGERNFHVFYYLLNGNDSISDREKCFLRDTYEYTYLGGGPSEDDLHDEDFENEHEGTDNHGNKPAGKEVLCIHQKNGHLRSHKYLLLTYY
jgi:hypothetical protein